MDNIKVVVVEPQKKPYIKEITAQLESYRELVGGDIQIVMLNSKYAVVCNESGKVLELQKNILLGEDCEILGTLFVTKYQFGVNEVFENLNEEEIQEVLAWLG